MAVTPTSLTALASAAAALEEVVRQQDWEKLAGCNEAFLQVFDQYRKDSRNQPIAPTAAAILRSVIDAQTRITTLCQERKAEIQPLLAGLQSPRAD